MGQVRKKRGKTSQVRKRHPSYLLELSVLTCVIFPPLGISAYGAMIKSYPSFHSANLSQALTSFVLDQKKKKTLRARNMGQGIHGAAGVPLSSFREGHEE